MTRPRYSIVIPTFRRPDDLAACVQSVCALDYPKSAIEVIIVDNGGEQNSRHAVQSFAEQVTIRYFVNPSNQGYGFSVNRGIVESSGDVVLLLNDDARPFPDLLEQCDTLIKRDSAIGCIGCRVIEEGYQSWGTEVGQVRDDGIVLGNYDIDCGQPIEVECVYGFCYAFTREAIRRAGLNDRTLLAQPYSSGNRIETDHCLSIREAGLKVIYNPLMVARHLAKPRPDLSEVSLNWHLNSIRNTLYLYLKHYGLFGKRGAALRLTFLRHVGIVSALTHPSKKNSAYFLMSLRARASAYLHYFRYLTGPRFDSPDEFLASVKLAEQSAASMDGSAQTRLSA